MFKQAAIWTGGVALLAATLVDTVAVLGRHLGMPVPGSIELMQAIVLVSGAIGLVIATWDNAHARVRLLVERLGPGSRNLANRASDLVTLAFVLCLLAGSLWLSLDLWNGYEQSEILGIPWAILRMIANLCLAACAILLAVRIVRGRK